MAKNGFAGVGGKAHKLKKMYFGVGGKAHKLKKMYFGVEGKARLWWSAESKTYKTLYGSRAVSEANLLLFNLEWANTSKYISIGRLYQTGSFTFCSDDMYVAKRISNEQIFARIDPENGTEFSRINLEKYSLRPSGYYGGVNSSLMFAWDYSRNYPFQKFDPKTISHLSDPGIRYYYYGQIGYPGKIFVIWEHDIEDEYMHLIEYDAHSITQLRYITKKDDDRHHICRGVAYSENSILIESGSMTLQNSSVIGFGSKVDYSTLSIIYTNRRPGNIVFYGGITSPNQ